MTLRFLGTTPRDRVAGLVAAAQRATRTIAPFELRLGALAGFPSRRPRAVVLDVAPHEPIVALARGVENAVVEAGFAPEERAFHPHLTLGRVRERRVLFLDPTEGPTDAAPFAVACFALFQSVLAHDRRAVHAARANSARWNVLTLKPTSNQTGDEDHGYGNQEEPGIAGSRERAPQGDRPRRQHDREAVRQGSDPHHDGGRDRSRDRRRPVRLAEPRHRARHRRLPARAGRRDLRAGVERQDDARAARGRGDPEAGRRGGVHRRRARARRRLRAQARREDRRAAGLAAGHRRAGAGDRRRAGALRRGRHGRRRLGGGAGAEGRDRGRDGRLARRACRRG